MCFLNHDFKVIRAELGEATMRRYIGSGERTKKVTQVTRKCKKCGAIDQYILDGWLSREEVS